MAMFSLMTSHELRLSFAKLKFVSSYFGQAKTMNVKAVRLFENDNSLVGHLWLIHDLVDTWTFQKPQTHSIRWLNLYFYPWDSQYFNNLG